MRNPNLSFLGALSVVSGVSVVCALAPPFLENFSLVCFSGALHSLPARTLCVVGWTQGTENSDPWSLLQVPPAGKLDSGDDHTQITSGQTVAVGRSLRWYAPIFLLFLLLSHPWFHASNPT